VQLYRSGRVLIENNEFFNVGTGVAIKGIAEPQWNDWVVVRMNLMHDIRQAGVWVHRTGDIPFVHITQNVFRDSQSGVMIHHFRDDTEPRRAKIVNNTFHHNQYGIWVQYDSVLPQAEHLIQNNIFSNNTVGAINFSDMTTGNVTTSRYLFVRNMYSGNPAIGLGLPEMASLSSWQGSYGQDAASVSANPLFVNLAGFDFKLQANSPARTLGRDVLDLNTNGNTTETVPAGAYITGAEIIGPGGSGGAPPAAGSSNAPAAPTNLRIIS
jgi:hypothetical protein